MTREEHIRELMAEYSTRRGRDRAEADARLREAIHTSRTPKPWMKASACARPCTPAPTMSKGPCGTGASRWAASSDAAAVRRAVTVGP